MIPSDLNTLYVLQRPSSVRLETSPISLKIWSLALAPPAPPATTSARSCAPATLPAWNMIFSEASDGFFPLLTNFTKKYDIKSPAVQQHYRNRVVYRLT